MAFPDFGQGMQVSLSSYGTSAAGPPVMGGLPQHVKKDLQIQQECDLYQQQLADLNACHSLLMVDQERLAAMLAPYVDERGNLVMTSLNDDIKLFKEGLDLRLKEFQEDCNRIKDTERRLNNLIEGVTQDYQQAIDGMSMSSDSRILKRLKEQQQLIVLQQQEIDQIQYEKQLLEEETKKLRLMAQRSGAGLRTPGSSSGFVQAPPSSEYAQLPSYHRDRYARNPAPMMPGTNGPVYHHQDPGAESRGGR